MRCNTLYMQENAYRIYTLHVQENAYRIYTLHVQENACADQEIGNVTDELLYLFAPRVSMKHKT